MSLPKLRAALTLSICLVAHLSAQQTAKTVTLKVERPGWWRGETIWNETVYVNGVRLGEAPSGTTTTFTFTPAKHGSNVIWACMTDPRYSHEHGNKVYFTAFPGAEVHAFSQLTYDGNNYDSTWVSIDRRKRRTRWGEKKANPYGRVLIGSSRGQGRKPQITMSRKRRGVAPIDGVKVVLRENHKEKVLGKETVTTPPGSKRTIKRTRIIQRVVELTDKRSVSAVGGLTLSLLNAEIRGCIERQLKQSIKTSESVEQEIEIDGDKLPKVTLVWVAKSRVGEATATVAGRKLTVPFEFCTDIELRPIVESPAKRPRGKIAAKQTGQASR